MERARRISLAAICGAWALAACDPPCPTCGPGTQPALTAEGVCTCAATCDAPYALVDGQCTLPPGGVQCAALDCSTAAVPAIWGECVESLKKVIQGVDTCTCLPDRVRPGYVAGGSGCIKELNCQEQYGPSYRQEGGACFPCEDCTCAEAPDSPACIPVACSEHPELRGQSVGGRALCTEDPPPPAESCVTGCHNGIEDPHPWFGGPLLTCTGCHGGTAGASTRETAHVAIPGGWQDGSPQWGRPNLRYYWNYNTLFGVENFAGGLEWLRFRNPGDLRVAEQSCGKAAGCHQERVLNVQRSVMATNVGMTGGALMRDGLPRSIVRGPEGIYKYDASEALTLGRPQLDARKFDPSFIGSLQRLNQWKYPNREVSGFYTDVNILMETYDKFCNDCHLNNAGLNHRYASFRSSGCSACHMSYALDGRSRSADQMIRKDEPTYPAAWATIANFNVNDLTNQAQTWLGPERSHPASHRLTLQIGSQRCQVCHTASNRTGEQYRGIRFDPNRSCATAVAAGRLAAGQCGFTDEIDNDADPNARYNGAAQNQLLKFEDWNNDGLDDSPADIHYLAGMECMDCHTSAEMHNELKFVASPRVTDWNDPSQVKDMSGALWAKEDQATEIECVHCHGNLEYKAMPKSVDARNPIRNLFVCGETIPGYTHPPECATLTAGRWMRSKFTGRYHYVSQVIDTVSQVNGGAGGGAARPNGTPVYTRNASIFHGRVNDSLADGVGPCVNGNPASCVKDQTNQTGQVRPGFSHLGLPAQSPVDQMAGGLECYACHGTWSYACSGCHLTLADSNGAQTLHDFSRATGEYTYGFLTQVDFSYIDPLMQQYGINAEGKISQFSPVQKKHVRHIDAQNQSYFGTQVIVNNDPNIQYNAYRHRSGYGLRQYATEQVGLPPNADGPVFDQDARMDNNAAQGFNQFPPHATQRSHPRMDCELCHLNAGDANADAVTARYGVNPNGFANVSAFLNAMNGLQLVRAATQQPINVNAAAGFRFDATIDPQGFVVNEQMDWVVLADGFPLAHSNHPMLVGRPDLTFDPYYRRDYPRFAQVSGPLNAALLSILTGGTVRVQNVGVQYRGVR
ncbi:MAG: hypothetical protein IT384_15725 [Deltaproteobacteria bacterium]|nr:hypothetical protein [Deltaproteobacteria bacterium]